MAAKRTQQRTAAFEDATFCAMLPFSCTLSASSCFMVAPASPVCCAGGSEPAEQWRARKVQKRTHRRHQLLERLLALRAVGGQLRGRLLLRLPQARGLGCGRGQRKQSVRNVRTLEAVALRLSRRVGGHAALCMTWQGAAAWHHARPARDGERRRAESDARRVPAQRRHCSTLGVAHRAAAARPGHCERDSRGTDAVPTRGERLRGGRRRLGCSSDARARTLARFVHNLRRLVLRGEQLADAPRLVVAHLHGPGARGREWRGWAARDAAPAWARFQHAAARPGAGAGVSMQLRCFDACSVRVQRHMHYARPNLLGAC